MYKKLYCFHVPIRKNLGHGKWSLMNPTRIEPLDWQRGLLALSIMSYHLLGWHFFKLDASSLLGRWGVYGVSMFFILSGLSMAIVYHAYIVNLKTSFNFYVRRIFRIWPLLWLAVFWIVAVTLAAGQPLDLMTVALNLTTAFGFVCPEGYLNTGAWSIGNEMVYYALTPAIIYVYNLRLAYGNLLTGITVLVGLVFSSVILTTDQTLAQQWSAYINPFNNLFLYCAGVAIFYNFRHTVFGKATAGICLLTSLVLFSLFPVGGDQINIVTGMNRGVFCVASLLMVVGFYRFPYSLPRMIASPLTQLGGIAYGVYLLHPIIHQVLAKLFKRIHIQQEAIVVVGLSIVFTIVAAHLCFKMLEAPFIRFGQKLTSPKRGNAHASVAGGETSRLGR
jgi:exopolysaccharide production protein ExoZ